MSKGPGRIGRAIAAMFDAEPENAFTVEELCERAYPGVSVEKKHRVTVIRAANNLALRRPEVVWLRGKGLGRTLVLCRRDNLASYALGYSKVDQSEGGRYRSKDPRYAWWRRTREKDEAELRQKADALDAGRLARQLVLVSNGSEVPRRTRRRPDPTGAITSHRRRRRAVLAEIDEYRRLGDGAAPT